MRFSLLRHGTPWAALSALLVLAACSKSEPAKSTSPDPSGGNSAPSGATTAPAAKTAANIPEAVQKFLGRWVRSDGGYTLELRDPEISGVLRAQYFNPKSINVSRSIWMQGPAGLQVVVELNDVGYPGATYILSYDPQGDRLVGQYTQPQMQQTFDIDFVRQARP